MRPYLATTLGALGIAWAPVFVALSGAGPVTVAFWRYAYALPWLAALVLLRPGARDAFRERRWIRLAVVGGVFFTIDLVLWHTAIGLIGAGPSTLLANTHVVWITLFGLVALGERPGPVFWLALPVLVLGMWMLAGGGMDGIPLPEDRRGLLLGAGTGLAYAVVLVCIRFAQRSGRVPPESVLLVQISMALAVLVPLAAADPEPLVPSGWRPHLWLVLLGVGVQVASWWGITWGIRRIPGYHGAVLLFAQPVGSVLLGWWVLGQALAPARLAGAGLILAAIALVALGDTGRRRGSESA
jgi:drug/metabolite transporter (DMT)-like permease